jgi:putative acetyltransferase
MKDQQFTFRMATNADTERIVAVVAANLLEFGLSYDQYEANSDLNNIERTYLASGGGFWVMENSVRRIIGTVGLLPLDTRLCKLRKMHVHAEYRGLKLGETLLQQALQRANEHGFQVMRLETIGSMTAAIHLYRKFGFVVIPDLIATSYRCDTIMEKSLG